VEGQRYRETLGPAITKATSSTPPQKRAAVLHAIQMGTFNYERHSRGQKHAGQQRQPIAMHAWPETRRHLHTAKAIDITPDTESRLRGPRLQRVVALSRSAKDRLASALLPANLQTAARRSGVSNPQSRRTVQTTTFGNASALWTGMEKKKTATPSPAWPIALQTAFEKTSQKIPGPADPGKNSTS